MFISRDEYIKLKDCKNMNVELEKEIQRLEYLLNTREKTCKIGPWCQNCSHWVNDKSIIISEKMHYYTMDDMYYGLPIPEEIGGEIGYCNKYIHTLCPDFLIKEQSNKNEM